MTKLYSDADRGSKASSAHNAVKRQIMKGVYNMTIFERVSEMTDDQKYRIVDNLEPFDKHIYNREDILQYCEFWGETEDWISDGLEKGDEYFLPDYSESGAFSDICGSDDDFVDWLEGFDEETLEDVFAKIA